MNTQLRLGKMGKAVGGLLSCATVLGFLVSGAVADKGGAPTAEAMPAAVRRAIAQRMVDHGARASALVQSALVLDYGLVEENAKAFAEAKQLGRPAPGEQNTLAAAVPSRFFDLQDQLKTQAKALSAAAHRHDDTQMGHALGQTLQTCIACHSTYLWRQSTSAE
jgi:cytochrome c556